MPIPAYLKGKKEKNIFRALDNENGRTIKQIANISRSSKSHAYRTIKKIRKRGDALNLQRRPMPIKWTQ